ncbi:hypothetical protein J2Z32_002032 [Paenibacillus turicensis]|uniref:DUF4181 domain-containing protein n=1 Tax=Paenibacillus turicensis TaxID=160487 RepID=A0ABS4FS38_9BACL|nr:hypothetical protein [Paenibacillus turicensis]MBP1905402.1 hypothetical protein [Paenibacillus turicensis]
MIEVNFRFYLIVFILLYCAQRILTLLIVEDDRTLRDTPTQKRYMLFTIVFIILLLGMYWLNWILNIRVFELVFALLLPLHGVYTSILEYKYIRETKQHIVSIYLLLPELLISAFLIAYYFIYN